MGFGETSAVGPADEINKEVGESVSNRSLETRGVKWLPGEMENRNLNGMVCAGMEETTCGTAGGKGKMGPLV